MARQVPLLMLIWMLASQGEGGRMPDPQVYSFLQKFLAESLPALQIPQPLPEINFSAQDTQFIPFELSVHAWNGTCFGPTALPTVKRGNGTVYPSGSAAVEADIYLGQLKMIYNGTKLNLFGFQYKGPLGWRLEETVSRLRIEVKTTVLRACEVNIKLEQPTAKFFLLPQNGFEDLVVYLAEKGLEWKSNFTYLNIQKPLGDWAFYRPLHDKLEAALMDTAHKMFCKYRRPRRFG